MLLHAPTLFLWNVVSDLVFAALLLQLWNVRRHEPALAWWSASGLCGALSVLLIGLRGAIPDVLSIALGNALLVFAFSLQWAGMCRFAGQALKPVWMAGLSLALGVVLLLRDVLGLDFGDRAALAGFAISAVLVLAVRDGWRAQRGEYLQMRRLLNIALCLIVVYHLVRHVFAQIGALGPDLSTLDRVYAPMLMVMSALVFLMYLSSILMVFERNESQLVRAASIDGLTAMLNRGGFEPLAERVLARRARDGQSACVLVMDLDRFKTVNDTYGHAAGDAVLRTFAHCVRETLRASDLVARPGGEEFWALLPATSLDTALDVAQRIGERFRAAGTAWEGTMLRNTVSIGVAEIALRDDSLQAALARADAALYQAKQQGRDRVVAATGTHPDSVSA